MLHSQGDVNEGDLNTKKKKHNEKKKCMQGKKISFKYFSVIVWALTCCIVKPITKSSKCLTCHFDVCTTVNNTKSIIVQMSFDSTRFTAITCDNNNLQKKEKKKLILGVAHFAAFKKFHNVSFFFKITKYPLGGQTKSQLSFKKILSFKLKCWLKLPSVMNLNMPLVYLPHWLVDFFLSRLCLIRADTSEESLSNTRSHALMSLTPHRMMIPGQWSVLQDKSGKIP